MTTSDQTVPPSTLIADALAVSTRLHEAIELLDEQEAQYELAGPPGLAVFQRDGTDVVRHRSGSPSPEIAPLLTDLMQAHRARLQFPAGADNSHIAPLVLLCLYLSDPSTRESHGLSLHARKPAAVIALDGEEARHDPPLEPHDSALRAWTPLRALHAPDAGIHTAALEFRFPMNRRERYAPW